MQGKKVAENVNDTTTKLDGSHAAEPSATMRTKELRSGEILADMYSRW